MPQFLVPQPLRHETQINENVVSPNRHLPARLMREQRAEQVPYITQTPLYQKEYGESGSAGDAVVLVDLG